MGHDLAIWTNIFPSQRNRGRQTTSTKLFSNHSGPCGMCLCLEFFCIGLQITREPMECKQQIIREQDWPPYLQRKRPKKRQFWATQYVTQQVLHSFTPEYAKEDVWWGQQTQRPSLLTSAEECKSDSTDIPRHVGSNCLIESVCMRRARHCRRRHFTTPRIIQYRGSISKFLFSPLLFVSGTVFVLFTIRVCCCCTVRTSANLLYVCKCGVDWIE